ncbi:deoxynucleoside triphosphate triphosphohydrolase SAMHD1 [Hermetia illucens]|uniref:deoxynucleoside triphosphate triphosphohydrolase SAMHD1 n=1 Tax=Hermetia illucens TaxID=343691 RepID=UPI0018CC2630|nr:deoxynucleoside triphosphate triphosphohydrolase SAMHD1 [Hermetia illucens]
MNKLSSLTLAIFNGGVSHLPPEDDYLFSFQMSAIPEMELFEQIVKTEAFQRLKGIKQLGVMDKMYPALNHTRYDHSIGVYSKAGQLLQALEENTNIKINDFHKLCVKLAGLLHDVGHGPYSHFWEKIIDQCNNGREYQHEQVGTLIINRIFQDIRLSENPEEHEYGVELINRLIVSDKENFRWRNVKEEFIFDIISNKSCGIDVDRFDYFERDWERFSKTDKICPSGSFASDMETHLENVRHIFKEAIVSPDRKHIQFNRSHIDRINSVFSLRTALHEHFYQHCSIRALEDVFLHMIELRKKEEDREIFLTFTDAEDYVKRWYLGEIPLNDEKVEMWLRNTSNPELNKYLEAYKDIERNVIISPQPNNGYEKVETKYKYKVEESIKDCLSGDGPLDGLRWSYEFNNIVYYKVNLNSSRL